MKSLLFEEEQQPMSLEEIAALLGGEVDGIYIWCPEPGSGDERSCCVRVNPKQLSSFYIYYCDGPKKNAYAYVRSRLGVIPSPRDAYERLRAAQRIAGECLPAAGSLVQKYLRARAITLSVPEVLRFHPQLWHNYSKSSWPAMVAEVTGPSGGLAGIHRTYLNRRGTGKAPVEPDKMTLGGIGGGAIRLCPIGPKIAIAEGIETALSITQATGIGAWSALSATGLRDIVLPDLVRHVVIAVDGDDAGQSEKAAVIARRRFISEGRAVSLAHAPKGKDFNDLLQEHQR